MKRTIALPVKRPIDVSAISFGGETLTIKEWSQRTGIPAFTIYSRLTLGWSEADAIAKSNEIKQIAARTKTGPKLITYQGETLTIPEWSERTGIGIKVIHNRLRSNWTPERTLTEPLNDMTKFVRKAQRGVGNDFAECQGTGGGRLLQEMAEIAFSGEDHV
ncbi:MAG: hypothetical protein JWS10_2178 [Cypionkella sp.]|uniref:hypothetical protein n=1 Tax=Cypionkella sp. TaxID=2811411 RepID=UPI002610880C|nr:hypothetical protein [Cypionkella sp.]MDB5659563.1 hypothetical protein [Cypionkella sp.]